MKKYLLGLDNGSTIAKAALFDLEGNEIAVSGSKMDMIMPEPRFTERDQDELWKANVKAIRSVLEESGVKGEEVMSLAVTGHGNGLYMIKEDGTQAYNGIIATDTRAKTYSEQWNNDGTAQKVLPKTMQSIWAGQPAPLLRWFKENNPGVLEDTRWILLCKDFIRYKLTGEIYTEITDMSGCGMMNVRDNKYDEEVLEAYGISEYMDKLPEIKSSIEICGYITEEVADMTGLKAGTPVAGGTMDTHSSAIATGAVDKDILSIIAGTWAINEYVDTEPVVAEDFFMTSIFPIDGHYLMQEGSPTSASNLEWFVTEMLKDVELKEDECVFSMSNRLVQSVPADESNIVFLPFLFGTNVNANAKATFIGMNGWHTRAHMIRALYEGVVFSHRTHIDKILRHRDTPKVGRIAGGVVNSQVWVQMFADILQIPIEVTRCKELGAMGAATCAGIAVDAFESFYDAADKMIEVVYTCYPNTELKEVYDRKYDLYKSTIKALDPLWKEFTK